MDFTQFLPYDVLCQIFSAHPFNNEECIEFTKVCRSWRNGVPGYTTMIWCEAIFSGRTWARTDMHMARFLGSHVQTVFIENFAEETCSVLQVLEMLTRAKCSHIAKLAFRLCDFTMDHNILSHLRRLGGSSLIELAFIQHMDNLPLKATIAVFPQLARFFYSANAERGNSLDYKDIFRREPVIPNESEFDEYQDVMFANMSCLSIDSPISYTARLKPILKKCPNLRVLRTGDSNINCMYFPGVGVNITDVFQWCSYLDYLECNNACTNPLNTIWWRTADSKKIDYGKYSGLEEFAYYEGCAKQECYDALHHITRSQQTLRSLTIGRNSFSNVLRWDHLELLCFPQLRSLKLYETCIKEETISSFIAHCPDLEEVYLDTYPLLAYYSTVYGALQTLQNLRDLTIDYKFAGDPIHGGVWYNSEYFELFNPLCDYLNTTTDKKLQRLHVNFNLMIDVIDAQFLSSVLSVPTLQVFALCNRCELLETGKNRTTPNDVVAFVQKLKSNTQIRGLTFAQSSFLYPSVFDAMAELEYLTSLLFNNCTSFTFKDVISLLEKTKSLQHLVIIDSKAKVWTDPSCFIDRINNTFNHCSYTAAEVNPTMISIRHFNYLASEDTSVFVCQPE